MIYDLGYHAATEAAERFSFGHYPTDSWEPDNSFRKEMKALAKETGTEIINLDKTCRDAYGWYWSNLEEQVADDPDLVDLLLESETDEIARNYLLSLKSI